MQSDSVLCLNPRGVHRMAYRVWGNPDNPRVLICVHGLARNGHDFDELARSLSDTYRVVCPDIVGRGESDWLPEGAPYEIGQYIQDMMVLIGRLKVEKVSWLGTSMGGIIGQALAALPGSPINRLILNDIGARVPKESLKRISLYMGERRFSSLDDVETYLRDTYPALAGISDKQWQELARHAVRVLPSGQLALHYDPAIAEATRKAAAMDQDIDLWPFWYSITCPRALIWGEQSDVLDMPTVTQMQAHTPDLEILALPEIGHAPSLMEDDQIRWIKDWLNRHPDPDLIKAERPLIRNPYASL